MTAKVQGLALGALTFLIIYAVYQASAYLNTEGAKAYDIKLKEQLTMFTECRKSDTYAQCYIAIYK